MADEWQERSAQRERDGSELSANQPPPVPAVMRWRISDRFGETTITTLIERYLAGETAPALAAEFKVGLTALKALLRDRKVRRKDLR